MREWPHKFRLLSVPHSGTRSIRRMLINAGYEEVNDFLQQHFTDHVAHWIVTDHNTPVIIPIRPKEAVKESYRRRGRSDPDVDKSWAAMERFIFETDAKVFLVHIEDEEVRDKEIAAISEFLGRPLEIDWSEKVGHGDAWV